MTRRIALPAQRLTSSRCHRSVGDSGSRYDVSGCASARPGIDRGGNDTATVKEPGRRAVAAEAAALVQGEQGLWQESI